MVDLLGIAVCLVLVSVQVSLAEGNYPQLAIVPVGHQKGPLVRLEVRRLVGSLPRHGFLLGSLKMVAPPRPLVLSCFLLLEQVQVQLPLFLLSQ